MIVLKSSRELELMKEACQISAEALMVAGEAVKPGASTKEIDEIAYKFIKKHDVSSSFFNNSNLYFSGLFIRNLNFI